MPPIIGETLRVWLLSALVVHGAVAGNPDAKRLYDDLLSNYNKLVRPVVNTSDVLRVCIKLKLSQLIDVRIGNGCQVYSSISLTLTNASCTAATREGCVEQCRAVSSRMVGEIGGDEVFPGELV
ncbi:hypothetical protein KQX54_006530 [Cotesia glomerata]|uniref:Neurotransmitter-gated ion-channel ligand-binding domain-containing protein n=1 Tax=Cotesia glomerata TaxID=32391 RepID=A0AAV7IG81_COTGL|nr:hypothetical protein KQX54_006530 [Cotesia glomerata]